MNIAERAKELRETILYHDRLYYVEARPTISDVEYDRLWTELEQLERDHPELITPDSPTQRVSGEPISGFEKVRHDPPMRSLDKTYEKSELLQFDAFLRDKLPDAVWDYTVEPKVDGLSLSLLYRDGVLVRAATRGNGEVGDDITANVKTIRSIPLRIATDAPLVEVRGEIYMTREGFAELNRREEEAGREPFANPRNAAAGSIKLLDPREVAERPLDAVLYGVGALTGVTFNTHTAMLRTLAEWGFRTPPWQRLCMDINQVLLAIEELGSRRHTFPFEIDGAVIKVNQRSLYASLGSTAHAPRFARAYKYAPEVAETRLNDITIQVGRTGVLTPVAELESVHLAGSVISRATLHNADMIQTKDFRIGDRVLISKHGDVIPAVDAVVIEKRPPEAVPYQFPTHCPVCGEKAEKLEKEVATRCVNPDCPAQRVGRLELFVSRNALDISAIGGRMAEALVQAGLVKRPLDLFTLPPETLASFKLIADDGSERRFGKKAEDVAEALNQAAALPLHRWITALGIPGIGETAARTLATHFSSLSAMKDTTLIQKVLAFYDATKRSLESTDDRDLFAGEIIDRANELAAYGLIQRDDPESPIRKRFLLTIKPDMAKELLQFVQSPYAKDLFERLETLGIDPKPELPQTSTTTLAGLSFVITGSLSQPREVFEKLIRENGGTVQTSVSKKTSYLLIGDNPGGSKYNKAQALEIPMLSEADFMSKIGPHDNQTLEAVPTTQPPAEPLILEPPFSLEALPVTNSPSLASKATLFDLPPETIPATKKKAKTKKHSTSTAEYIQEDLF